METPKCPDWSALASTLDGLRHTVWDWLQAQSTKSMPARTIQHVRHLASSLSVSVGRARVLSETCPPPSPEVGSRCVSAGCLPDGRAYPAGLMAEVDPSPPGNTSAPVHGGYPEPIVPSGRSDSGPSSSRGQKSLSLLREGWKCASCGAHYTKGAGQSMDSCVRCGRRVNDLRATGDSRREPPAS